MHVRSLFKFGILLALCFCFTLFGCSKRTDAESAKSPKTNGKKKQDSLESNGRHPRPPAELPLRLLPEDAVGYLRIRDVARVRKEFIQPTHVKDAARIHEQVTRLIQQAVLSFGRKGNSWGVKGETLLNLFLDLDRLHVGVWNAEPAGGSSSLLDANLIAVLDFATPSRLDVLFRELKPKLEHRTVAGAEIDLLSLSSGTKTALYRPAPKTLVLGTQKSLESALRRSRSTGSRSLADSPAFQTARRDWGDRGELFAYLNLQAARKAMPQLPAATITHVGASLRLDGGLALRAYANKANPFPKFLVRTSREKKFLSRIPADAVFLLSAVSDGGRRTRKNFVEWVMEQFGRDDNAARSLLPQSWRRFAETYTADPQKIEGQAFTFIEDLLLAVLPVKSESAFFIAPDKTGRYGAAFLFDIEDREQMRQLSQRLFEMGNRAKLPWKQTVYDGLTIRYVDFAEVARKAGRTIPPEVAKRVELQVGYAQGDDLFLVGTLEAIKFARKPTGKTLAGELTYDNVDAKNAIMLSLRPGRILHRTFGVPQVDSVLKRLAAQIPKESNYAVTLSFEPTQLTFRTNIPFVSLIAWLVTEWQRPPRKLGPRDK